MHLTAKDLLRSSMGLLSDPLIVVRISFAVLVEPGVSPPSWVLFLVLLWLPPF
jgi:hypothetical protein